MEPSQTETVGSPRVIGKPAFNNQQQVIEPCSCNINKHTAVHEPCSYWDKMFDTFYLFGLFLDSPLLTLSMT